ncbi:MAG: DUF5696 domain-containing protein [Anaerolineae bacterium]
MKRIVQSLLVCAWLFGWIAGPLPIQADVAFRARSETGPSVARSETGPSVARSETGPSIDRPAGIPDTYELAAENATFQLYFDRSTLAFKVVDKRSGYVWHSNLDETEPGDKLNKTWTAFARSGISLDYLDEKATPRRVSITTAAPEMTVATIDQGFAAQVTFADIGISVGITVTLESAGVRVAIPSASIAEAGNVRLHMIYVYPFFGATRNDAVPGYMLIPDGCGSLIRFAAQTKAQTMFYGRYYGADLGMTGALPFDPQVRPAQRLSLPVIGMVHGEKQSAVSGVGRNAYLAIVEKGAAYGELQAHPAGIITNFNFIYNVFIYNESYFQPTNRAGAGVTMIQPRTNTFDVVIHYRFLTGDDSDYVGMARSYQQYLLEQGVLRPEKDTGNDIGIRLEFLGAEKEKVLFWQRAIPMTTIAQMQAILTDLALPNPEVVIYGWQPLGAATMPPTKLRVERALGSLRDVRALADDIAAQGGRLSLYLDPQAALQNESGYSRRYDLAMSIMRSALQGASRNKRTFYFNLEALARRYAALSAQVTEELGAGLAVDGLGFMLYSDFRDGRFANREDAIRAYQQLLAEDGAAAFYRPNDYLWAYAAAYYDVPIADSGYIYTSGAVPFVQTVLAGYIPLYGPALNFSSNVQDDLLRHADFGVYPSFFLTHEGTTGILNTSSRWIYTSSYQQWGDEVKRAYTWLNRLLGPVRGQPIVARETLAEGVTATCYANGKQIIVNYTDQPVRIQGVDIPAKDAVLLDSAVSRFLSTDSTDFNGYFPYLGPKSTAHSEIFPLCDLCVLGGPVREVEP